MGVDGYFEIRQLLERGRIEEADMRTQLVDQQQALVTGGIVES